MKLDRGNAGSGDTNTPLPAEALGEEAPPVQVAPGEDFASVVAEHAGPFFGIAKRLLGNHADAEDAVQENFSKIFQHWGRIQASGRPEAYMYRMLYNSCLDAGRRNGTRQAHINGTGSAILEAKPPSTVATEPITFGRAYIKSQLGKLDDRHRQMLVDRFVRGHKLRVIAENNGIAISTIGAQLNRIIRRLKMPPATDGPHEPTDSKQSGDQTR